MKRFITLLSISMISLCSASFEVAATTEGTIVGGAVGAVAGAVIGDQSNQAAQGAVVGAILGGLAGAVLSESSNNDVHASEKRYHRQSCRKGRHYFDQARSSRHLVRKINLMREGIRFCPNNAAAHNDLGVALELYGDHVSARIEFNRAIRLDSGYRPAHINLAHLDRRHPKRGYKTDRSDDRSKAKRNRDSGSKDKRRRHDRRDD